MNSSIKKLCLFILLGMMSIGVIRLYYRLTDDFRLSNMTYRLPFEAPWQVPTLSPDERAQLTQILDQKFSYLGKGAQCYAFASEDGQYVLKFFQV